MNPGNLVDRALSVYVAFSTGVGTYRFNRLTTQTIEPMIRPTMTMIAAICPIAYPMLYASPTTKPPVIGERR
jgi:hypothetical protein